MEEGKGCMESQEGIEGNLMELQCPKLTSVSYAHMDTWLMSHKYCWAMQKFRQEDQKLSGSEAFMRRSDSLKRVSFLLLWNVLSHKFFFAELSLIMWTLSIVRIMSETNCAGRLSTSLVQVTMPAGCNMQRTL